LALGETMVVVGRQMDLSSDRCWVCRPNYMVDREYETGRVLPVTRCQMTLN
jgi:hypothetical protein